MTAKWHTTTLDEACHFSNGLWKGEKLPFVSVGVIRNTNFTKEGLLDDTDIAYLDVEAKKFETRRLQFGDIILEKSGGGPKQAVGRVALFEKNEGDFSFSNFTSAIRVRDPEVLDYRFLHKLLYWTYISGVTEGMQSNSTGIRNLDGNAYKALRISFPEIREQHRIVAILDEAFAGIATAKANADKNLQNARGAFEIQLQDIFSTRDDSWSASALGELADFRNGINFTKTSKGKQVRVLGVKDFRNHFHAPDQGLDRVTINGELDPFDSLQPGDIVFVRSNGNPELIGRSVVIEAMSEVTAHSGFTIRARLRGNELVPSYLGHFLKSNAVRRQMVDGGTGTNIKSLNQGTLSRLSVPYPSHAEQKKVVEKIEKLRSETQRLESLYTRKLAALDELKQSLLQQAFSGQLS